MTCRQCGATLPDAAIACGRCGFPVAGLVPPGEISDAPTVRLSQPSLIPDASTVIIRPPTAPPPVVSPAPAPMAAAEPLPPPPPLPPPLPSASLPPEPPPPAAAAPRPPAPPPVRRAPSRPSGQRTALGALLVFAALALVGVAGLMIYRGSVDRTARATTAASTPAMVPATAPAPPAAAPAPQAAPPDATTPPPATTTAEPPPGTDVTATPPTPPTPADAPAVTPPPAPDPNVALLAKARKDRDAAVTQRDAALDQVKRLKDELASARGSGAAAPAVAAPAPAPTRTVDTSRLTALQTEHDTLRYIAGSRKQLMTNKVIESHLYLLPPPPDVATLNLATSTNITIQASACGLNKIKTLSVIPSTVWEGTDFKYSTDGTSATFTILKPDAFRTFAKFFAILVD